MVWMNVVAKISLKGIYLVDFHCYNLSIQAITA